MDTPLGALAALDLADGDLCLEILASEKHQLVERLVVESVFDIRRCTFSMGRCFSMRIPPSWTQTAAMTDVRFRCRPCPGIAGIVSGAALPPVEDQWPLGLKATG
ncbi:hypothetical protein [Sphingomonas sp.]|uniref:hypothetical protein n=1 Tax=Sphingomonas sp. TaxID=28214 RepID=UPI002EDB8693